MRMDYQKWFKPKVTLAPFRARQPTVNFRY